MGAARSCTRFEEAISARADGESPGMDTEVIDAHLARCTTCSHFAAGTSRLHRRVRVRAAGDVPDLTDRILAAIPDRPAPRAPLTIGRHPVRPRALVGALVALVVILGGGFELGTRLAGSGSGSPDLTQVAGFSQVNTKYPDATVFGTLSYPKPSVMLTDTQDQPYDVAASTKGRITLLYFGYTHCPDLCPINMALTSAAVGRLPAAERHQVTVVFITTDPRRDHPAVIQAWLNSFSFPKDTTVVGLTGSQAQIHEAERQAGVTLSYAETATDDGNTYNIVHEADTRIYSRDGRAHMQVDATDTPIDYAITLEHLFAHGYQAS